jgi:hypothetical protein
LKKKEQTEYDPSHDDDDDDDEYIVEVSTGFA